MLTRLRTRLGKRQRFSSTLDGELSVDIDLSDSSPDHKDGDTRQKGEDDSSNEFREHALLIPRTALRLHGIMPLTVFTIIADPHEGKLGRDAPDQCTV